MAKDLLVQLFEKHVKENNVPDELSIEFPEGENPVIRFTWEKENKTKDYGYTQERYIKISEVFTEYYFKKLGGIKYIL